MLFPFFKIHELFHWIVLLFFEDYLYLNCFKYYFCVWYHPNKLQLFTSLCEQIIFFKKTSAHATGLGCPLLACVARPCISPINRTMRENQASELEMPQLLLLKCRNAHRFPELAMRTHRAARTFTDVPCHRTIRALAETVIFMSSKGLFARVRNAFAQKPGSWISRMWSRHKSKKGCTRHIRKIRIVLS